MKYILAFLFLASLFTAIGVLLGGEQEKALDMCSQKYSIDTCYSIIVR